jgi:hypothetical protein
MTTSQTDTARRTFLPVAIFILLFTAPTLFAEPTTFRNAGLKNEMIVTLEMKGKSASGTFVSYEYGEDVGPGTPFTGKVVPTPKGKKGVYLQISFAGGPPYGAPPEAKSLVWYLKMVNRRPHLFIPMHQRSYEGEPPKWVVADVELEPDSD